MTARSSILRLRPCPVSVLLALCLLQAGCSAGGLAVTTVDGDTGKVTTTRYSKYFETAQYLAGETVGLHAVVDQIKKRVPGVYDFRRAMGLLGPDDLSAGGLITLYFHNLQPESMEIVVESVTLGRHSAELDHLVTVPASGIAKWEPAQVPIFSYATSLAFTLSYRLGDESHQAEMKLDRLTVDEANRRYGGGREATFPWTAR
ncbi:MAG: hypothetical protein AAF604_00115 [Acidobacteriota bacterium]